MQRAFCIGAGRKEKKFHICIPTERAQTSDQVSSMADHSEDLDLDQLLDSASDDFQNLNHSKPSLERSKEAVETKREPPSLPSVVQGLGMGLPDVRNITKGKQKVSGGSHVTESLDEHFEELCFLELFPVCICIRISKFKQIRVFDLLMHCKMLDESRAFAERMKQGFLEAQRRRQQLEEEIIQLRAEGERLAQRRRQQSVEDTIRLRAEGERLRAEGEERMVQMRLQTSILMNLLERLKSKD